MNEEQQYWRQIQLETLGYPLIAMQSEGGPFDDESFLAGFFAAKYDVLLQIGDGTETGVIPTKCLPQLDLMAMRYGCVVASEDADLEGWSFVRFSKGVLDEDLHL